MEFLDCRGCYQPLSPPVFQCSLGHPHFLCSSCSGKLPESKCKTCSGVEFRRCPAIEDAVSTILLPCKLGCGDNITYYGQEAHGKVCKKGPCFCPERGCGFTGPTAAALLDHFTTHHNWPATTFIYGARFDLPAGPGIRVLRTDDGHLFLLNVASLDCAGDLRVSLVSVQANTERPVFTCSFAYQWRSHQCSQNVWLDNITNSSLSDGLPKDNCCSYCLLPVFKEKPLHCSRASLL
uniref:Uncharacterized protein n=1 Tax=Avena sativa TaxID=4498 RepID=A0ACD5VAB7_AVESA